MVPQKPRAGPAVYVGRQINHATRTDKLFGGRPAAILTSCARAVRVLFYLFIFIFVIFFFFTLNDFTIAPLN